MTWYTAYKRRLDQMVLTGGPPHETPLDIAHRIISASSRVSKNTWAKQPNISSDSGENVFEGGWSALKNGGKSFLDIISRPLYGNTSAIKAGLDAGENNVLGSMLSGYGRGFTGKEKILSQDLLKRIPSFNDDPAWLKFATGLAGDIVLDPLSYVGVGAARSVASAGFKVAGKAGIGTGVAPKLGRAKNALTIAENIKRPTVVTPESLLKSELNASGQTKVQEQQAGLFLKSLEQSGRWGGVQPKIEPFATVKGNEIPLDEFGSPKTIMPPMEPSHMADLAITNSASKALSALAIKKYPTGAPPIAQIYTAGMSFPKLPQGSFYEATRKHLLAREAASSDILPVGNPLTSKGTTFGATIMGKVVPKADKEIDDVAKHLNPIFGKRGLLDLFDAEGAKVMSKSSGRANKGMVTLAISKERLSQIILGTGPKLDAGASGYRIKVGNELVPLTKFIKDVKNDIHLGITPEVAKVVPKVTEEVVKEAPKLNRLNPVDIAVWVKNHPHLSKKDSLYIIQARSAKSAQDRINEVSERLVSETTTGKVRTVGDIENLIKQGLIDPKDPEYQRIIQSLISTTGAKKLSGVDKRLKEAMTRIEKAEFTRMQRSNPASATEWQRITKERLMALVDNPVADAVEKSVIKRGSLVEAVLRHGNTTVFDKGKIVLDQAQADAVKGIIQRVTHQEFIDPANPTKYPYVTPRGTARTKKQYGQGFGRKRGSFHKWSQLTLSKDILAQANKLLPSDLKGPARASAMYDKAMPMLHAAEQMLRQSGLPIILGKESTGLPLSLHDVLSALPRATVEANFFNYHSAMDVTQITSITEQIVRLAKKDITPLEFDANTATILKAPRSSLGMNTRKEVQFSQYTGQKQFKNPVTRAYSAQLIADDFRNAAPQIVQALERNIAEAGIEIGEHTAKITNDAIDQFAKIILKPDMVIGDIIGVFRNPAKLVDDAAMKLEGVSQAAKDLSKIQLEIRMASVVDGPAVKTAAKGAEKYAKTLTSSERAQVATELFRVSDQEALGIMKDTQVSQFDVGMHNQYSNNVAIIRAFHPHYGNKDLRPLLLAARNFTTSNSMRYGELVSQSAKKYTTEQAAEAFRYLQEGKEIADPAMRGIMQDLKQVWGEVLGDSHPMDGFIGRNGITKQELDRAFKHFGVNSKYNLDSVNLSDSWRTWDVEDPLDLASKVHAAAQSVMVDKILGASFNLHFGEKVYKPGFNVRIGNTGDRSRVGNVINRDLYFPEDIARQMGLIDKTLEEFSKPATNNRFLKLLDGTLHSLKAGLTIYRFGHHTRNQVGDMWLSSMDGLWQPKYYQKGLRVMFTRKGQYGDFDSLKALQASGSRNGSDLTSPVLTLMHGGKKVTFTPDEVYKLAYTHGLLPNYNIIEDLSFDPTLAGDFTTKLRSASPFKGKIRNVAAGVSEWRDHYVRISHFIYAMEKTGLKEGRTLEDAIKIAADKSGARVRKWHPDGSDLSEAERTVARRSILFYSWIRKAIPLVVESAVTHPGRFMVYPKATYNFAVANGIDLQGGIGDQFPTDQLFPDWMQDSTQGPQMGEANNYWGLKPGIPSADVMDQYGTSPLTTLQTIAGSVNPMVKVPMEIAAQHSVGTGTSIKDSSEYIDNQIPFGGFLNKITGKSASSGFTQDVTTAPSNEGYEPTIPVWLQALLNTNTGGGLTNYSKPSYIKQGQFTARDAAKAAAQGGR